MVHIGNPGLTVLGPGLRALMQSTLGAAWAVSKQRLLGTGLGAIVRQRRYARLLKAGKPTDNASIEALNGHFSAECLNEHWFMSLENATEKSGSARDYNEVRPHGAINISWLRRALDRLTNGRFT